MERELEFQIQQGQVEMEGREGDGDEVEGGVSRAGPHGSESGSGTCCSGEG